MKEKAYVTLLTTDNYIYYILGLYESWLHTKSKYKLYCAITNNISTETRNILDTIGMPYFEIDIEPLQPFIQRSNTLGMIAKYKQASNKLALLGLEQFEKCVYLDSDMLILQNIDELFDKPDFSSVEDCLPVHYRPAEYSLGESAFCAGMFVFSPSKALYTEILQIIDMLPTTIKWNDQNILAYYIRDWMKKPELHLPCEYELNIAANENVYQLYLDLGGKEENIKIKHFVTYKNAPYNKKEYISENVYEQYINYYTFINTVIAKYSINIKKVKLENILPKISVDLVIPYVNNEDPIWQKIFKNSYTKAYKTDAVDITRFRSQKNFFRYFFRSMAKNLPWINNIFLLASNTSQVPAWLSTKRGKVRIITHEQFIPKQYLPTFNSGTIEMFLWNIPGLSNHFIYANDDIYAVKPLSIDSFFTISGQPKFNYFWDKNYYSNDWRKMCQNNHDLIFKTTNACPYLRLDHELRPYIRTEMQQCYKENETAILKSISQFRQAKNLTVYLFSLNLIKTKKQANTTLNNKYLCSTSTLDTIKKSIETADVVCLNDTDSQKDIYNLPIIRYLFYSLFSKKCKYELDDAKDLIELTEPVINIEHKKEEKKDIRADGKSNVYLYF